MNWMYILAATETAHAPEVTEPSGIAALGVAPLKIALQLLTFLVLFAIIKRFALDKIVATLEKRRQTIDDGIRLGRAMEAEKASLAATIDKTLKQARQNADTILAEAREEAGGILRQAEVDAQSKIETLMTEAQRRIDADLAAARSDLQQDMTALVTAATETLLQAKLDDQKDAALVARAIAGAQRD